METADVLKLLHPVKYDMLSWWTLVVTYKFTMSLDLYYLQSSEKGNATT